MTPRQKESLLNHLMELDEGIRKLANIHWNGGSTFTETQRSLHDLIEICENIIKRDLNEASEIQMS